MITRLRHRTRGAHPGHAVRRVRRPGRARRVRDALTQWKYPREFRVPRPFLEPAQAEWIASVLGETEVEAEVEVEVEAMGAAGAAAEGAEDGRPTDGAGSAALVGTAVGIWRALRKLGQDSPTLSAADLRQVRRQIIASRQALADDGLEIQDHDGTAFDSGLSLEVLLFQDEPGLSRETVLETVRPSVYFRGERIQMGQVIVGRPAPLSAPAPVSAPGPAPAPERGTTPADTTRQVDDQGEHDHA